MSKLHKFFVQLEEKFCVLLLVINVSLVFFSAVGRALGFPSPWSVELAQTLFAWFAFSSASVTWRKNEHVNVDLFSRKFPPKISKIINIINYVFIGAFLALLSVLAILLAIKNKNRYLFSLPISYSFITISVGIFGFSMFITTIQRLLGYIKNFKNDDEGRV